MHGGTLACTSLRVVNRNCNYLSLLLFRHSLSLVFAHRAVLDPPLSLSAPRSVLPCALDCGIQRRSFQFSLDNYLNFRPIQF